MNNTDNSHRRMLEQSGEVLREHENYPRQSDGDSLYQNKWEQAMKDMPSFEDHIEQMEEDELSM